MRRISWGFPFRADAELSKPDGRKLLRARCQMHLDLTGLVGCAGLSDVSVHTRTFLPCIVRYTYSMSISAAPAQPGQSTIAAALEAGTSNPAEKPRILAIKHCL